jgi:hypothetical protein
MASAFDRHFLSLHERCASGPQKGERHPNNEPFPGDGRELFVLRGSTPVLGWAPQNLPHASEDLTARLLDLYAHRDPALGEALSHGLEIDRIAVRRGMDDGAAKACAETKI